MKIHKVDDHYRAQHISGPSHVLVSIKYGVSKSIEVNELKPRKGELRLDVERYVSEIEAGVKKANEELSSALTVSEIGYVGSDNPGIGVVKNISYEITKSVALSET